MTEEILTDEHPDDQPKYKEKKKPIPLIVSCIGYISTEGYLKTCTTGPGLELPSDFKEWANDLCKH
ncbi:hypothetical protein RO575_22505 [Methylomonas sp. MO1]|uniref:hypothetical protein n=1 Tax=Methylomonas sp. MO1 TaxID=3073619 RepID=UPI0028A2FD46|nr:hypothetical protein [Methylomonas sp. MO1]MDT4292347.1 hypothetical protein [Methylomonas sp. MO1]